MPHISLALSTGIATTTFEVDSYGAHGDGSTDDSAHIQAAYNAAKANSVNGAHSTVHFTSGKNYRVTAGWNLDTIRTNDWYGQAGPTYQRKGVIAFSGYGATISYPSSNSRFGFLQGPNPTAQYATYGNLVIEGLLIDNNNRQPGGDCGNILWIQGKGNVDNVTVKDVTTTDNVADRAAVNSPRSVNGIYLLGSQVSRSQAHYGYITNVATQGTNLIHAQGKGIMIGDDADTSLVPYGTNMYMLDNLNIDGVTVDNHKHAGSNIMLGGSAVGYRCQVTNCDGSRSDDDGVEIDAFNQALVQNCSFHRVRQAICITWFSYPYLTSPSYYTVDNCHYSGDCGPYWALGTTPTAEPVMRSPMMPELLTGGKTALYNRRWGNFTISNCDGVFGVSNPYSNHLPFVQLNGPMDSVNIHDIAITDVGAGGTLLHVVQMSQAGITLPLSIHNVTYRTANSGAYAPLPLSKASFSGAYALSTDMV
jgi:hypothetical protein